MNVQHIVFEKIRSSVKGNEEIVDQISDALNISKSAVYKRMKGDTCLSMEDLAILMKTFHFSFDDIIYEDKSQIGFKFPYKDREIKSFMDFIEPIKQLISGARKLTDIKLQYATSEFHFFFYLNDKDLTYFKFYIFARTVWNLPAYKNKAFSFDDFGEWALIEKDVDMILKAYYQISNVEIWNGNVLANTLSQILYALKSGVFRKPEEALFLCDKLENMITHVQNMAEKGKKYMMGQDPDLVSATIDMYHNEITQTNNILLAESQENSQIYFAYDNPNYILTDEKKLVDYTIEWFDRIKKNALPISNTADRNRQAFFGKIKRKIDRTREQIHSIIKYEMADY